MLLLLAACTTLPGVEDTADCDPIEQFADQDGDGLDDLLLSSYYGTTGTSWSNSEGYGWSFWGGGL